MQKQPDAAAILDAVAKYLQDDVLGEASPAKAYHLRVAVNALHLSRREIRMMADAEAGERGRLTALLGGEASVAGQDNDQLNARLADEIYAGRLGFDTSGLVDHLWTTSLAQLAIDQPKYGKYSRLPEWPAASED